VGDQPDVQGLYPHRTNTTQKNADTHPCPERDSNPRSQCSKTERDSDRAAIVTGIIVLLNLLNNAFLYCTRCLMSNGETSANDELAEMWKEIVLVYFGYYPRIKLEGPACLPARQPA
jgi:hypothetical protein